MVLNQSPPDVVEVLIVGAGPAGIAAAHVLNNAGIEVLMVDARAKVGYPLRCGEMTRREYLDYFGVEAQPGWTRNMPDNLGLYLTRYDANRKKTGESLYRTNYSWIILDREKSEFEASRILARRGVHVIEACSVSAVGPWQQGGRDVTLLHAEKNYRVRARLIIAADGPSSLVSRYVGIARALSPAEVISYYGYELDNINLVDPGRCDIYMYPELDPFYFWIFPHAKDRANVGLGVHGYRGHLAKPLLDDVMKRFPFFKTASVKQHIVAWTPSAAPLAKPYADGVIAVGGAARLTGPISGEGLWSAVCSGKSAAEYYVQYRHQDVTEASLSGYTELVRGLYETQRQEIRFRMDVERTEQY